MKKQSSVDWLNENFERELLEFMRAVSTLDMKVILQYSERLGYNSAIILDKARQMHREEIQDAFVAGDERGTGDIPFNCEQYYTQTFNP